MKNRVLPALALSLSLALPAAASELPPYAGSHDDASYSDGPRASFAVELPTPDGHLSLASSGDDAAWGTFAPARPARIAQRDANNAKKVSACTCRS